MPAMLTAQTRTDFGKEKAKKMRREGLVPGVIYGTSAKPEHVTLPHHDLDVLAKRVHGQTVLVDLEVKDPQGSRVEKVFLRELQRDPVSEKIVHVDWLRVDLEKPVIVEIPIVGVGTPAGVKLGGLLERLNRTVSVRCLPQNVPPHIEVDISEINVGHSIHVGEVPWPTTVEVLTDEDTALFTVLGKREVEEEVAAPEEAAATEEGAAEPEVIGRKKKEEEGETEE